MGLHRLVDDLAVCLKSAFSGSTRYSELIAIKLGVEKEECDLIRRAAPMHDAGILGIPDGILLKPGRLDAEEMKVMRRHACIGHDIPMGSEARLIRVGAEIALAHHERFDGEGYPQGFAGEAISIRNVSMPSWRCGMKWS